MNTKHILFFLTISVITYSCKSFMFGSTEHLTFNSYHLVKKDKKDFGNKRIKHNMGHHKNSGLYYFLKNNGNPDFIYEYETTTKSLGIQLFYIKKDSVFVFEELQQHLQSVLKEGRRINEKEKSVYRNLLGF